MQRFIIIDRGVILNQTDNGILFALPNNWQFWYSRRRCYRHPSNPEKILVSFDDDHPSCECVQKEGRKETKRQYIPWTAIARVNGGEFLGTLYNPVGVEVPKTKGHARRYGKHTPETLQPLTVVKPHASLIR